MRTLLMVGLWILTGWISTAWGSENDKGKAPASVTYEKNTRLDFDEAVVDGQFQNPDAQLVDSDRNVSFDSMIELKKDFNKEMKRSSGAIR